MTLLFYPNDTKAVRRLKAFETVLELLRADDAVISITFNADDGYAVHTPETKGHLGADFVHEFISKVPYALVLDYEESVEMTLRTSPSAGQLLLEDALDKSFGVVDYTDKDGAPHRLVMADLEVVQQVYVVDAKYTVLEPKSGMVVDRIIEQATLGYYAYGDTLEESIATVVRFEHIVKGLMAKLLNAKPKKIEVKADHTEKKLLERVGVIETEPVWA